MPPHLPPAEEGVTVVYSDWRPGLLDHLPTEERARARDRVRLAATKGHALRLTLHPGHIPDCAESYTEVVAFHDPDDGHPRQGIRTVHPRGEELALYPDKGQALTAYGKLAHRSVT